MNVIQQHVPMLAITAVCLALGVARATFYRRSKPRMLKPRSSPPRKLSADARATVLATLNSERFCDLAPAQVYAMLLEEERYLCSERTMYVAPLRPCRARRASSSVRADATRGCAHPSRAR